MCTFTFIIVLYISILSAVNTNLKKELKKIHLDQENNRLFLLLN